jgi:hypothetical protein
MATKNYKAQEAIFQAKLAIEEVKQTGGDITDLNKILESAESSIKSKDYSKAIEYATQLKSIASTRSTIYNETFQAMSEAAAYIAESRNCNVDSTKAIELLLAARTEFERGNYQKAYETANECAQTAKYIVDKYKSAKTIIEVRTKLELAEKLRLNVATAKNTIDTAISQLKENNFAAAQQTAKVADKGIENILRTYIAKVDSGKIKIDPDQIDPTQQYQLEYLVGQARAYARRLPDGFDIVVVNYIQNHPNDPDVKKLLKKAKKDK